MIVTINDKSYEIQTAPLQEHLTGKLDELLMTKDDGSEILRGLVKTACKFAMSRMGLEKKDRNDDVIKIVILHLIEQAFHAAEKAGIRVQGTELPAQPDELPFSDPPADADTD